MSNSKVDALCKPAARGDVGRIRELLSDGTAVNGKELMGLTPLMYAAERGHVEAVRVLLAAGADPAAIIAGDSVLRMVKDHIAIAKMDDSIAKSLPKLKEVEALLKNAAPVLKVEREGTAAGARSEPRSAVASDLPLEDDTEKSKAKTLRKATSKGEAGKIRQMLADGAPLETLNENKWTPVMLAACGGHAEAFRVLVEAGANLHHRGLSDTDLIGCAAEGGNVEIVRFLLGKGHPVEGYWQPRSREEKRVGNFTPLMVAAVNGHVDAVHVLLAAGADRDAKFDGETALMCVQQSIKFPHGEEDVARLPQWKAIVKLLKDGSTRSESEVEQFIREVEAFTTNSARPEYAQLRQKLASLCGKGKPWKPVPDHGIAAANAVSFTLKDCKSEQGLETLQAAAREARFQLVLAEPWLPGESAKLILFPTADKYAVVVACGTVGANYAVNTPAIIAWLRQLDLENPFDLTLCNHESLGCRFRGSVKGASKLARSMVKICPSVMDVLGDEALLAAGLKKEKSIYLRWD